MKDLAGQKIEIPQFRHYITEYFSEALGSFGASRGHMIKNEFDKCILFILDAFGFETMSKLGVLAGLNMRVEEFGSVLPSVTPSALASISTGEFPAKHGVIGKEFWVPKAGCGVDAFSLTNVSTGTEADLKSGELLLTQPLMVQAQEDGIKSWSVYPDIYGASFSDAIYKGTNQCPSSSLGGFHDSLFKFIHSKDPLAIAHWPNPDILIHYGIDDGSVKAELNAMFSIFHRLKKENASKKVCLILAGDHGSTPISQKVNVKKIRSLLRMNPLGNLRFQNFFIKRDAKEQIVRELPKTHVFEGSRFLESRLMGKPHEEAFDRVGDLVVFGGEGQQLMFQDRALSAGHGSFLYSELSTAFAFCRLSEFKAEV